MRNRIGGIIGCFACIFVAVIGTGAILWIIFSADWSGLADTKPVESTTYTPKEPQQKTDGHCSILTKKCIVDEWSPKCLWFECIVDGRGKE